MHPLILGAGLLAAALIGPSAAARCPPPGAAVAEHFIPADCADCWARGGIPPAAWRFDWVLPAGADAPLSAASLGEAAERQQRLGKQSASRAAAPRPGMLLKVGSGPAWQGYFGVQMTFKPSARQALPTGASAWLALVELLPAGSEGNAAPRALLRAVAGPLPLHSAGPGQAITPITHLRALRWPEGAKPERLQARGWIEAADGRLLAVAADRCP